MSNEGAELFYAIGNKKLAEVFRPEAVAHVGIDIQAGYCKPPYPVRKMSQFRRDFYTRTEALLPKIAHISEIFRAANIPNIWVWHNVSFKIRDFADTSMNEDYNLSHDRMKSFMAQAKDICLPVDRERDILLDKIGFSMFKDTNHAQALRDAGIDTLLLSGGYKDRCVAASARDAAKNGFHVFVIDDLTYWEKTALREGWVPHYEDLLEDKVFNVSAEQVSTLLLQHQPALA